MDDEFELVRGSDNPFRDAGIPDAESATVAARLAEVAVADISRIRKAALHRFTIDHLVKIHNRLDQGTRIRIDFSYSRKDGQTGAVHRYTMKPTHKTSRNCLAKYGVPETSRQYGASASGFHAAYRLSLTVTQDGAGGVGAVPVVASKAIGPVSVSSRRSSRASAARAARGG